MYRYEHHVNFWKRDEYGLLPNVEYFFKEDEPNKIDWKKMILPKFLTPIKEKFPKDTDFKNLNVSELPDDKVLILLDGIKYLALLRGYTNLQKDFIPVNDRFIISKCSITFIGNFETNMKEITYTGEGDATPENTKGFGAKFLTCTAGNRSFTRAVRNALEISILGWDEINGSDLSSEENSNLTTVYAPPSLQTTLASKMKEAKIDLNFIKEKIKETHPHSVNWQTLDDIPASECCGLIERVKAIIEKKKEKK